MGVLERLIGKPLVDCSREELEDWVMKGRTAREVEAEGAKKKTRAKSGKKKVEIPDFDLLDDDFELED